MKIKILITSLFICSLTGCVGQSGITKQEIGLVAGSVAGGVLANQVFHGHNSVYGVIGGAALGSLLGSSIGQSMDQQDKMNAEHAAINVPIGHQANWTNPRTNTSYTVTPVRQYHHNGCLCKQAQINVYMSGKKKKAYTTVCKDKYGHWHTK